MSAQEKQLSPNESLLVEWGMAERYAKNVLLSCCKAICEAVEEKGYSAVQLDDKPAEAFTAAIFAAEDSYARVQRLLHPEEPNAN